MQLNGGGGSGAGASPTLLNVAAMEMDVLAHVGGMRFSNGVALKWEADASDASSQSGANQLSYLVLYYVTT